MKYEGSWRRITVSASHYYADFFFGDWDKLKLEIRGVS